MKRMKRTLSLLLALVLLATLLPIDQLGLIPAVKASDYNPTIDFEYAEKNNVTTASDALRVAGEGIYTLRSDHDGQSPTIDENYYKSNYNKFRWKHCDKWDLTAGKDATSINTLLQSTDDADTYIALTADDVGSYSNTKQAWQTIKVTKSKVLDLNGHKFRISYDRNVHQGSDNYQMTNEEFNKCTFLEIEEGATLTIIDSSAWRGENGGQGTGELSFTAYMIAPYLYDIEVYTTRDLFWVNNGNLVIYGGTFQAGRKKDQLSSKFSWDKFTTVIGQTVELGVAIAEYASGISVATSKYQDLLKQQMNMSALEEKGDTGPDDGTEGPTQTMVPRTGAGDDENVAKENKQDTPQKAGGVGASTGRDQTVDEKKKSKNDSIDQGQPGTKDDKNKENKKGTGKDDSKTSVVEAQKNIATQALDKNKVTGMVEGAISLVKGIAGMIGTDSKSRVTQSIKGTVVHVGNNGAFVAYGGTFKGYGSTPNTRNAVIEVNIVPETTKTFDYSKTQGGLAYIYGGTFEAYNGANVFNMIRYNKIQYAMQYTADKYGNKTGPTRVPLEVSETNGVEVLYYDNQEAVAADTQGTVEPIPVNTANVQVRGGVFRCFYDIMNVAVKGDSSEHFTKFPGTMGAVNLGIESFNEDLIYDGRIQISDKYGDGALVLLDERKDETDDTDGAEGLIHYRLFCGDNELRYKSYLEVYPNTARTNTSHSMQLTTYEGSGKKTSSLWTNDKEGENIRSPYCMTENYFDYMYDSDTASNWSVMPNFHFQASKDNPQEKIDSLSADVYGKLLDTSEVWYYPTPRSASGPVIEDVAYGEATANFVSVGESKLIEMSQKNGSDEEWKFVLDHYALPGSVSYWAYEKQAIRTNMRYFTYRVYRVDPLTRENISESDTYGEDVPLITVRYGASASGTVNEALKCKLPLKTVEREIKRRQPFWKGYQSGEMYRVVLDVEEYVAMDYQGRGVYGQKLDKACSQSSILFRCFSKKEQEDTGSYYKAHDFTPLQWKDVTTRNERTSVNPDSTVTVDFVNAKAGMTDHYGDTKVFDVYYQWWEVEADGTPIRMIAGTDNLYDPANGSYGDHRKESWNVGNDGKTYVNTVDPDDPKASTYTYNGLPGKPDGRPDNNNWKDYQLHAYLAGTTPKESLTPDGTDNLALDNNKIFQTGMDSCYIPKDMAGKYLQVKAIVQNVRWPMAYDSLQTFRSHVIKVSGGSTGGGGRPETTERLTGDLTVTYSGAKDYAGSQSPVTFRIDDVRGLGKDEKITSVYFVAWAYRKEGSTVSKEFTNLSITDPSQLPTVRFPNDFYPAGYDYANLDAGEYYVQAKYKTSDGRTRNMSDVSFNYQVEATGIHRVGAEYQQIDRLDTVRGGKYVGGKKIFEATPSNATTGFSFSSAASSNPGVATVDDRGYLQFTGTLGTTVVSCTGPDGKTASATVQVTAEYYQIAISDLTAPTVGETFPTSASAGRGAGYRIDQVYWTVDNKSQPLPSTAKAENYHSYTVNVVIASKDGYTRRRGDTKLTLTATLADGSLDVLTGTYPRCWNMTNYDDGSGEEKYLLRYKFDGAAGGASRVIDKIYLEFPDEVVEGDSVADWMADVHVYTNGDNDQFTCKAYSAYDAYAFEILESYGKFRMSDDEVATFIPGVQSGLMASIDIPVDLNADFPSNSSDITVYINGEPTGKVYYKTTKYLVVSAYDSLTVLPGVTPEPMPRYSLNDFDLVVGQTVHVEDLLVCDDSRVTVRLDDVRCDYDDGVTYYTYDLGEGIVTAVKVPSSVNYYLDIYYSVVFDANGDGIPEFVDSTGSEDKQIYANNSAVPANPAKDPYHVTVLDPEENVVATLDCPYGKPISIPEVENAFVYSVTDPAYKDGTVNVWNNTGSSSYSMTYGSYQLDIMSYAKPGDRLVVHTAYADELQVKAGAHDVRAFVKDENLNDVPGLMLSVDGEHFVVYDAIVGLEPNTDYVLYYKQGVDGTVYTKPFRTAEFDYGVYVGRNVVTPSNLGNLERDGWHYDPASKTLTLKDINLVDKGVDTEYGMLFTDPIRIASAIYSRDDLTIELLGDNSIMKTKVRRDLVFNIIYAEGDLTIQGTGNLTLPRTGDSYGLWSANGSIYLNGTGTLTFDRIDYGMAAKHGTINYSNGTIEYIGRKSGEYLLGALVSSDDVDNLLFTNKVHNLTISVGDINGNYTTVTEQGLRDQIKYNADTTNKDEKAHVRIVPAHSDVKKVTAAEFLKSGSCTGTCTYYYSCECGHIGSSTFNVAGAGHELIHHEAQEPTCLYGGWAAYDTCAKCGYSTFQELLPLGHDWVHYELKEPTCTEDGYPAYDVCTRCGVSTRLEMPDSTTIKTRGVTPQTGEKTNDNEYLLWLATGHDFAPVAGTAPTCTAGGTAAHYRCVHCGEISLDETGTNVVTEGQLARDAIGHAWSPWEPIEEGAAVLSRFCLRCGEVQTRSPGDPTTDRTALDSAVNDAAMVDRDKYTDASLAKLDEALASARAVQADPAATQDQVDAAAAAVNAAIAGLEEKGGETANPFVDVKEGAFYYDPVLWAVSHDPQITKGTDATHFSPDATCTRGQVVTFLWRAAGCPEPTGGENPFTDVKEGAFYYKAVLWAVEKNITKGTGAATFSPDQGCTRGQVVTFLHRFAGTPEPGGSENPFGDVKEGAFYYKAVLWAVEKNVTKGLSATSFGPDATCTRGQIVTFLYRAMK